MENLVSADWLAQNLERDDVVILDCSVAAAKDENGTVSYQSGRDLFEQGHIPRAAHADLVGPLSDAGTGMLFALPSPDDFRDQMALLGVGDDSLVVLYDRSITAWAARVWWMLRWIGFDNAVILDGGLAGWTMSGKPVSDEISAISAGHLSLNLRPETVALQSDVQLAMRDQSACLIDTLAADNFTGQINDYARPGHIPGAQNVFAMKLFEKDGRFKSKEVLARIHAGTRKERQITYCGAGILASTTAFVLVQLGYDDVAVYTASLQEWAANDENPMEK